MRTITPVDRVNIAVLAFDGISPFHLSVPCMVFGEHLVQLACRNLT